MGKSPKASRPLPLQDSPLEFVQPLPARIPSTMVASRLPPGGTAAPGAPPPPFAGHPPWRRKWAAWCRLKRLEFELWQSRRLQAYLQEVHCPSLAASEAETAQRIEQQIWELKRESSALDDPAPAKPAPTSRHGKDF